MGSHSSLSPRLHFNRPSAVIIFMIHVFFVGYFVNVDLDDYWNRFALWPQQKQTCKQMPHQSWKENGRFKCAEDMTFTPPASLFAGYREAKSLLSLLLCHWSLFQSVLCIGLVWRVCLSLIWKHLWNMTLGYSGDFLSCLAIIQFKVLATQ